jgi:hypothetical protein
MNLVLQTLKCQPLSQPFFIFGDSFTGGLQGAAVLHQNSTEELITRQFSHNYFLKNILFLSCSRRSGRNYKPRFTKRIFDQELNE